MNCDLDGQRANCWHLGLQNVPTCLPENITYLDIYQNDIPVLDDQSFQRYPNLVNLLLESNHITNISAGSFSSLVNLESLSLAQNYITTLPDDLFQNNANILYLSLGSNSFASLSLRLFRFLNKLTALRVLNNNIREIITSEDTSFVSSLKFLDLSYNSLTVITESLFANINGLQVSLFENPWFCDCDNIKGLLQAFYERNIILPVDPICNAPTGLDDTPWTVFITLCYNATITKV